MKMDLKDLITTFLSSNIQDKKYFLEKTILDLLKNGIKNNYLDSIKKKDLVLFLKYFENKNKPIRKLSLILVSLILTNKYNKKKFMEILELGMNVGKIYFSNLKNISKFFKEDLKIFLFVKKIDNFEIPDKHQTPKKKKILFWYINLKKTNISENLKPKIFYLEMLQIKEKIILENIPDPLKIFSGFKIQKEDLKFKKKFPKANSNNIINKNIKKRKTYDIFYKKSYLKKLTKNYKSPLSNFQNKIWSTINKKKDSIQTKKRLNILTKNLKETKFKEKTKKKFNKDFKDFKKKGDYKKNLKSFLKISKVRKKNFSPMGERKDYKSHRTPDFFNSKFDKFEFSYY